MKRRPVEAIQRRTDHSAHCERLVLDALAELTKTGTPFTVEDVCKLAGVGKTFIYDKRRPAVTRAVLLARDASQQRSGRPPMDCAVCGKPEPNEWCWEGRIDCPFGKPPRHLDVYELWVHIAELQKRVAALEHPPCCKGGPQWGHAWDCPTPG